MEILTRKVEPTEAMKEELRRFDEACAIERYPGNLAEYTQLKGGERYEIIDTGKPEKFIKGCVTYAPPPLDEALMARKGKLRRLKGTALFVYPSFHNSVNSLLLQAYDLGAEALIYYRNENGFTQGVPVRRPQIT